MIIGISGQNQNDKDSAAKILRYFTFPITERNISIREFFSIQDSIYPEYQNKKINLEMRYFNDIPEVMLSIILNRDNDLFKTEEDKNTLLNAHWDVWVLELFNGDIFKVFTTEKLANDWIKKNGIKKYTLTKNVYDLRKFVNTFIASNQNSIHPNIWIYALMENYFPIDYINVVSLNNPQLGQHEMPIWPSWVIPDINSLDQANAIKHGIEPDVWDSAEDPSDIRFLIKLNNTKLSNNDPFEFEEWDYILNFDGTAEDLVENVYIMLSLFPKFANYFYI